jgi:hypothetical protein
MESISVKRPLKTTKMMNRFFGMAITTVIALLPALTSGTFARNESAKPLKASPVTTAANDPGKGVKASFPEMLHARLELSKAGLDLEVLEMALKGYERLRRKGVVGMDSVIAIADFGKPSSSKRLYVIDLKNQSLVYQTYVAHGRNSGGEYANRFSNKPSSNMSSLGFYVTRGTYMGSNGYSLVLDGCEKGINDKARDRAIVMHPADYANEDVLRSQRYLGRSFGCPALPEKISRKVIDKIKGGNVLFIYHPETGYTRNSSLING